MNYIRKNLNNLKKVLSVLTFLGMMLSSFGTLAMPQVVEATAGGDDNKVTICHYNSGEKTYTQNSVSKNSIEKKSGDDGGHGEHEEDIIPPFGSFNGQNWGDDGQAIYYNGCKAPTNNEPEDPENPSPNHHDKIKDIIKAIVKGKVPTDVAICYTPSYDLEVTFGDHNQTIPFSEIIGNSKPLVSVFVKAFIKKSFPPCGDQEPEVPVPAVTIHTYKVVCDAEEYLPNWQDTTEGNAKSVNITSDTAGSYVSDSNGKCHLAEDWQFQWIKGIYGQDSNGDYTGVFPGWNAFSGSITIPIADLANAGGNANYPNTITLREVLPEGYVPFSNAGRDHGDTSGNVSAELYCANDGWNYDNNEYVGPLDGQGLQGGEEVHCVAFNAKKPVETPEEVPGRCEITNNQRWGGTFVSASQGKTKEGSSVFASRSVVANALDSNVGDSNGINYYSLGFGGEIVVKVHQPFTDGPGNDIKIYETSYGDPSFANYPEQAGVFVSADGNSWTSLGVAQHDTEFDLAGKYSGVVRYIKVVDESDVDSTKFNKDTDGFDLSGIEILGCDTTPEPTTATVQMCKVDGGNDNAPLAGWQLSLLGNKVETHTVNSKTNIHSSVVSTSALPAGSYVAKAGGTFKYRGGTGLLADARFAERQIGDPTYPTGSPTAPWNYASGSTPTQNGWLYMNNSNTVWGTTFSPAHTYYASLSGGVAADFFVGDNQHSDNVGNLTVDIYNGFTGVTGENGCVTFEGVPYGTYNVEELLQSGWENVSGLGSVTVSVNSFTNDGINRFVVTNKQIGGDGPVDNNAQLSIGGMKFHNSEKKTNPRGDYHAGFDKLPNWTFNLYREDSSGNWGSAIKTTTTDVDGNFNFKVNGAGTYHVCEVMQTGWSQVRQDRSGTPYHIVTENASPNRENEGPYCSTTVFDGSKNHSTKKYFGNYQEESGGQEPQMCMIVSDNEFNSVDNHLAVEVTSPSGNWFSSSLLNPAKWIWSSSAVETPTTSDVEKTFTRKFTVTNPSASANLEIASDNGYKVVLNGTLITDRLAEEFTYSGITTHDVSGKLVNGTNTLVITVRNHGLEGSTPDSNPAGLLYRLEVSGEVCGDIEFVPESSTNGGGNTSGGGTTISSYGQGGGGGPLVEEVAGASDSFGEVAGDSDSFPGLPNTGFAGVGYERAMAQNGLATTVSLAILAGALYFVRRKFVATVESK